MPAGDGREGERRARRLAALAPLRPFPAADDLPVVVAARMSLSFTLLISAVPLHALDMTSRRTRRAVEAVEAAVAEVVLLRGPERGSTQAAIEQVRTRLALVEEARAELAALGGAPSSFEQLRRELDATSPATPQDLPATEAVPEPPADPTQDGTPRT